MKQFLNNNKVIPCLHAKNMLCKRSREVAARSSPQLYSAFIHCLLLCPNAVVPNGALSASVFY